MEGFTVVGSPISSNTFMIIFFCTQKTKKITLSEFRKENVSVQFVDSISVLWRTRGYHPGRSSINSAQHMAAHMFVNRSLTILEASFIGKSLTGVHFGTTWRSTYLALFCKLSNSWETRPD
jgi:hypothetical protein